MCQPPVPMGENDKDRDPALPWVFTVTPSAQTGQAGVDPATAVYRLFANTRNPYTAPARVRMEAEARRWLAPESRNASWTYAAANQTGDEDKNRSSDVCYTPVALVAATWRYTPENQVHT